MLGDVLFGDLTEQQFRDWRNGLVKNEDEHDEEEVRQSRDTANRLLSIAKAAFNHSPVKDGSAWRAVKPFKNVGEARKVALDDDELQRLVDACGPGLRELVLAGALTGARLGELTGARVRDLDRDESTLHVTGKTGSRDVYLDLDALKLFKRLASGKRPADYLLTTADGGPWTKSLHQRPLADAVKTAGLDPETTFYSLRHSYISGALRRHVPIKGVADQCGTSLAMIQRYYAKHIKGDQAKYAEMAAPKLRAEPATTVTTLRPGAAA